MDQQPVELQQEQSQFEYATTGQRLINLFIDTAVVTACSYFFFALAAIVMIFMGMDQYDVGELFNYKPFTYTASILFQLFVFTLMESMSKGRTVGKLVTRTVAVRDDFACHLPRCIHSLSLPLYTVRGTGHIRRQSAA